MHVWMLNSSGAWGAHPLTATHDLELHADGNLACLTHSTAWQVRLLPCNDGSDSPAYVLLVKDGAPVRLNGQQPLSVSLLQDRDEIMLGSVYAYYTTEVLAEIVPFAGAHETIFCARCKSALAEEGPAVQCPACSLWYHETEAQPCWSYAQTCVCSHPSTVETFVWWPQPIR
jgi:hypothetical protein